MPELPAGTVTFLFTDLESSTRLWEGHPDAMRDALARHDEILRAAVEQRDGFVVKTTGDGLHAAFATSHDAVLAAVDAQRALGKEQWVLPGPLRVRMGVHTGEAEVRDGDYYGTAVNRAARLAGAAHGGQVVVSHATEEVGRDHLGGDLSLVDLGEHHLRDLARPEHVFQVVASGLDVEFPPLRSLDSMPGNLLPNLSPFIGRHRELATISSALRDERLLTLTGVGGVGKTRLATQVAAEVLPRFRDGSWLCELAAVGTAEGLAQAVAAALGVRPQAGVALNVAITDFLRTRELLLVLDNCEHLLLAAGRLASEILRACADVRILATSREGLGIDGERMIAVRSLEVPDETDVEAVATSDAALLFATRGAVVRPGFMVDAGNAATVAEICTRLDGIPLALELAAARLSAMSPAEIANHLDERFRLLAGGRQLAVERHQTLRSTVDWSYALLGEVERAVFDRLGVFVGSFDADMATGVCAYGDVDPWGVLDALRDLVAKSMVTVEEARAGSTRYHLLETMRQYARERLDEADATDHVRRRHATRYAEWAEQAGTGLLGPDELRWRATLRAELDNLRAAVAWALDADDAADRELGLRIVAALSYQAAVDRVAGISTWSHQALAHADSARPELRIGVLGAAAWDAAMRLDYDRAFELASMAIQTIEEDPETRWAMAYAAVSAAGVAGIYTGRFEEANELAARVQVEHVHLGVPDSFVNIGFEVVPIMGVLLTGDMDEARERAEQMLAHARRIGNPSGLALGLYVSGWVDMYADPEAALDAFDESIALVRSGASDQVYAHVLVRAGAIRATRDDRSALSDLREAIAFSDDVGSPMTTMAVLDYGVRILAALGEAEAGAIVAGFLDSGKEIALNPVEGPDQAARQSARTRIEHELDGDRFAVAAARGADMSYRELTDYLLRELDTASGGTA